MALVVLFLGGMVGSAAGPVSSSLREPASPIPGAAESPPALPSSLPRELLPGQPVEAELAPGETHVYAIRVEAGQFVRVAVEASGAPLEIALKGPDGESLMRLDTEIGLRNSLSPAMVSMSGEIYLLEIRSPASRRFPGRYWARIEELRPLEPQDEIRIAAERTFSEALRLRYRETAEALRESVDKHLEALSLWRTLGNRKAEAVTLDSLGVAYQWLGEAQKAIPLHQQAFSIAEDLDDQVVKADALSNLGVALGLIGDTRKSIEYYEQALDLYRLLGNRLGEAASLTHLGRAYWATGHPHKAADYYHQALPIRRETGDRRGEALTLNNLGLVLKQLGEVHQAVDMYQQALVLSREDGDRRLEAGLLNNLAAAFSALGELQQALDLYRDAAGIHRQFGDRRGQAYTLHNLGSIYQRLGDVDAAVKHYERALSLHRETGNRAAEANTLHVLGWALLEWSQPERALEFQTQALQLGREIESRTTEALSLRELGRIQLALGHQEAARNFLTDALAIARDVGDRRLEAATLHDLGRLEASLNDHSSAVERYTSALNLWRSTGNRQGEALALLGLSEIQHNVGHLQEARKLIADALTMVESRRWSVASLDLRSTFLASKREYYEKYIDVLMDLYKKEPSPEYSVLAFEVSEQARARALLDALAEAYGDVVYKGADPKLLAEERRLRQRLNVKEQQRMELLSRKPSPETKPVESVEVDIYDLISEHRRIQETIRRTSPRYAALTQPEIVDLDFLQRELLDEGTALLEFFLGDQRGYLWVVTKTSFSSLELPPRSELEGLIRRLHEQVPARNVTLEGESLLEKRQRIALADAEFLEVARLLSEALLRPAASQIDGKRLVIVADGALHYLPFAALPDPAVDASEGYRPLIAHHEVVSLPSASVAAVLRKEQAARPMAPKILAVLADPVFGPDDSRVRRSGRSLGSDEKLAEPVVSSDEGEVGSPEETLRGNAFGRLPFTRVEAGALTELVSEEDSFQALDFQASREIALSSELARYRYLHFATHGVLHSEHPQLSGIVLSLVDREGNPQDGFVRLHDIYNLELKAELVTLSACETALGKEIRGEGLIGLTRGFMYAGVPRVVASLWSVQDRATAELMARFYQGMLQEGKSPAAALREAQLSLWQEGAWQAPYYWGAFLLQGEWK